jgi:hypothetical protein
VSLAIPGTTADWFVGGAYVLWVLITLCWVLRCRHVCPGVVSTLAPSWPLFAPRPVDYDYEVGFRPAGAGGALPWKRLPTRYARAWHHAVWNPGFHEHLFLFKLCQFLAEVPGADRRARRQRRRAHRVLRSLVAGRAGEMPDAIELRITRRRPLHPGGEDVVFQSGSGARGHLS